jgi:hypothetical protein
MERFRTDEYPHLVEMATEYILQPGYDFGDEFEFGLTVILDALTKSLSGIFRDGFESWSNFSWVVSIDGRNTS